MMKEKEIIEYWEKNAAQWGAIFMATDFKQGPIHGCPYQGQW